VVLLYGANGYTGRLIARRAAERGLPVVVAGRSARRITRLGAELSLPHRIFPLDDADRVADGLQGASAVLSCAGPFIDTFEPLARACIAAGVHYLDVTGEIDVFEGLAALGDEAAAAGVMLLPGVGFDVVPTDCVAAHLVARLPDAYRLLLGFAGSARGMSRGTARTMVRNLGRPSRVRRGGRIVDVPPGALTRDIDFGRGPRHSVAISWGDVATAWYTTGIPNIEVYRPASPALLRALRLVGQATALLGSGPVRALAAGIIRLRPEGPDDPALASGRSVVWGRVENDAGAAVEAVLHGPDGYVLTAEAALLAVAHVLAGDVRPGFQTPAGAYGVELALAVPGVRLESAGPPARA
jgi:short subunit dehydrogenase-like uncharacterized protein